MTVQDDLLAIAQINIQIAQLKALQGEAMNRVMADLNKRKRKTITASGVKATYVAPVSYVIDEERLHRALPAAWWKKVTRPVLDKEKLEAFMVTGDIDPNVVASCSVEKASRPYLKISGSIEEEEPQATPHVRKVRPRAKRA